MLEILRCDRPEDKRELFGKLQPERESWIVSDLQSKWHLQKELLNRDGVLDQSAVLRATELWKKLSFRMFPEVHLLSSELAQTLFWNWIEPKGLPWARSPQVIPVVMSQMQMWMGVFADPNHEDIMSQWFQDNQESYVRWGHWFELCAELWRRCQDENLLMVSWLPSLMLQNDLSELRWERDLIFDLGPQMSLVEGLLIQALGRQPGLSVKVIHPQAPWIDLMRNTLRPYEILTGATEKGVPEWQPNVSENISFGRFSTQLAETKDAVAHVRAWLDEGVSPQDIAIVTPDIEEFWPSLQLYFEREGIPVCKPLTSKLGGFVEIARWLSKLRTAMAKVSTGDLEVSLFADPDAVSRETPKLSYDEFRVLFTHVYDAGDLRRAEHLFRGGQPPAADQALPMAEMLGWALRHWGGAGDQSRLFQMLQVIGEEVPRQVMLKPAQWLKYLEGITARREVSLAPADENGIWCVSLSSADWLPVTHGIFLNLNEGSLRSLMPSPVSASEAQKIFADTGYAVGAVDRQEHEFEFLWFLQKDWQRLRLGFSGTDFQGGVLTPSRLWIWAGILAGQFRREAEAPARTRWDELQRVAEQDAPEKLRWAMARDRDTSFNSWGEASPERLSASALEKFWDCPFIYGAERRFKQSDDPAMDLDLDHRGRGSLLHAIVEGLTAEPMRFDHSESELAALIDAAREREGIRLGDERLWPAIRAQHIRLALSFLQFEREWRTQFPETRTVGRELAFDVTSEELGGVRMRGRLDRVDRDDSGRYALIDYKAGAAGLTNWQSWLPGYSVQLALYAMLLERGLTSLPAGPVVAANYYVVKRRERHQGFRVRDETAKLYPAQDRGRSWINEMEKAELFAQLQSMLKTAVTEISAGRLNPNPRKITLCESCNWRSLCRAPHLA